MDGPIAQTLGLAADLLAAGDAREAFQTLRPVLSWPGDPVRDEASFRTALAVFARVVAAMAGDEVGAPVSAAAAAPDDTRALYDAAYVLYEQGLQPIAATLLDRANRLAPGELAIVTELCACLEPMLAYGAAARVVDASRLAEQDPFAAYLSGFNWLMTGDVERARLRVRQLAPAVGEPIGTMREALAGMVARADAVVAAGIPLDDRALTAWQAVIDGTVLLHESPHGHDDPMHGRYAYVSDSPGLMREGIERVGRLLGDPRIERVVAAPDRASGIVAAAAARHLGLPWVRWDGEASPVGLVAVWSMDAVDDPVFLQALRTRVPGQVLFVHTSSWVEPFPYAPDVTTHLHQLVTNPYTGGALRVVDGATVAAEPDPRDEEALATEIVGAPITDGSVSTMEQVLAVARAIGGVGRGTGHRLRQRAGSPVTSSRFT